jgi:PAS domain S-box-containing protein
MEAELRNSGIDVIGAVPWGTHFCQFYKTKQDLIDILVPYFKAGLENNEFCMWVTSEPLVVADARQAMREATRGFDEYLRRGQMEIIPYTEWYLLDGDFDDDRVLDGWVSKLEQALGKGYSGLRLTGNTFWLERNHWRAFTEYEAKINNIIGRYHMMAACTYSLDKCDAAAVIDVVKNHQFALIKQERKWDIIESSLYKQAKEALRQTEGRFRAIYEQSPIGIELYDADGNLVMANQACLDIFGTSEGEVRGFRLFDDPNVSEEVKDRLRRGETVRYELAFDVEKVKQHKLYETSKSGNIHVGVTIAPLDHGGSTQGGYLVQVQDITSRKYTEDALRDREQDLNRAQAVARIGSWRLDIRRNLLLWSGETYRMFGIPEGTPMTYEAFLLSVHTDDRDYVNRKWTAALRGEPYDVEHRIVVNNSVKWVHEKAELEFDSKGQLKGGFGTVQDITERKLSEEQYRTIVRTAMDGFWLADAKGKLLDVNDTYCRLIGYSREELLTMGIAGVEAAEAPHETARHIESVKGKGYDRFETRHRSKDGQIIDVEVSVNFMEDEGGRFFVFIRDITERKKTEQMKDEFIGLVSHELRTPLTVISGSLQTAMSQGVSPEDIHELLRNATEAAASLGVILENMLELSRHQAGRLQLRNEPVSVGGIARKVAEKLKRQGVDHRFVMRIPQKLPEVRADPVRVERVLLNLMENAAKYSPEDSRITVTGRTEDDFVVISVADHGIGISEDDQTRIFERFQRLETSQRRAKGIGLGLVVCKRLVEAQGGWIRVDSKLGRGSTFSFALPAYRMT